MSIINGATVHASFGQIGTFQGSSGQLTISGQGSSLNIQGIGYDYWMGNEGNGSLRILDGGKFYFGNEDKNIIIARTQQSTSEVIVSGENSILNAKKAIILAAENGTATININDQGSIFAKIFYSASQTTGHATILLDNSSKFYVSDAAALAISGYTYLSLNNKSIFSSGNDINVAVESSSTAKINITGNETLLSAGSIIYLSLKGDAELTANNDATLKADIAVIMALNDNSNTTLNIGAGANDIAVAPGIIDTPVIAFGSGTSPSILIIHLMIIPLPA